MSLNESFFTLSPPATSGSTITSSSTEVSFITIVLAIVIAWVLVAFWTRTFENLAFGTLGLNGDSFWHSLITAVVFTILFLAAVWVIDQYDLVPGTLEAEVEGLDSPLGGAQSGVANVPGPNSANRNGNFVPPSLQ